MPTEKIPPFDLGLDLGSASCGWALLSGDHKSLHDFGVRCFDGGTEGDIEGGRDESRNAKRRQMRLQRRGFWRRSRRMYKIFIILQRAGLLPSGDSRLAPQRDEILKGLDRQFAHWFEKEPAAQRAQFAHLLPYLLRKAALDARLEPFELGRAFYHLAQRRGFLSNRKQPQKDDKELGDVKKGISELAAAMEQAGARTLGEYFAGLNPELKRIRRHYTARQMFVDEFEKIWRAQARHHSRLLNDDLFRVLRKAMFFQRPLKSARHLVGHCELEPGARRAPMACMEAQHFRILQKVNDLLLQPPGGRDAPPDQEQRSLVLEALAKGDQTFPALRKLLKLKGVKFNFEHEGEDKLPGHRTNQKISEAIGAEWFDYPREKQDAIIEDLLSFQNEDLLKPHLQKRWNLDASAVAKLAEVKLEDSRCALSRKALRQLLPLMEGGMPYATARKQLESKRPRSRQILDRLPPVLKALPELRNPAVCRTLTEMRKVVNEIIRRFGKPAAIRVELARELKQPRDRRVDTAKRNFTQRKNRERVVRRLIDEAKLANPRGADIEKALLFEECGGICPYTGKAIPFGALFGPHPEFDIEHIIPLSRCLDDSFLNKTLCHADCNRQHKGNKAPRECFDDARLGEIFDRVKRFRGEAASEKLRRFQMTTDEIKERFEGFCARQLNDTKFASRLAAKYLGLLYGGLSDGAHRQRVFTTSGQATAFLRNEWNLNRILSDGPGKSRDDHRHHAIDAVVAALTTPAAIQRLSQAAEEPWRARRKRFAPVAPPWPEFEQHVRAAIQRLVVSHRARRKVATAIHEETLYSPPRNPQDGRVDQDGSCVHVRKPIESLSLKEVEQIVDPAVRKAVLEKLGGKIPKEAFKSEENRPFLQRKDGSRTPIRAVRIRKNERMEAVAQGHRQRFVATGSNHHIEIVESKDAKGKVQWEGHVVTSYEALRRARQRLPVVQHEHGADKKFLFSLCKGDIVRMNGKDGSPPILFRIASFWPTSSDPTGARFSVIPSHLSGKKAQDAQEDPRLQPFRKRNPEKVQVSVLGEVHPAHD